MGWINGGVCEWWLPILHHFLLCTSCHQSKLCTIEPINPHPRRLQALLHGMVGVGIIGIISKLHQWDESAQFFDGSSLGTMSWPPEIRSLTPTQSLMSPLYPYISQLLSRRSERLLRLSQKRHVKQGLRLCAYYPLETLSWYLRLSASLHCRCEWFVTHY